jgi:dihydrofolate synthase/folylpolyglutamate synthase
MGELRASGIADVPADAIRTGLARTRWPGRLEIIDRRGCTILLDGAHNPDGARALADAVDELRPSLPPGRAVLLAGVMADKEVSQIMRAFAASGALRTSRFVASGVPDSPRALAAADLARAWWEASGVAADAVCDDADAALERALEAAATEGGPLVVAGSLYLVGHLRGRLLPERLLPGRLRRGVIDDADTDTNTDTDTANVGSADPVVRGLADG